MQVQGLALPVRDSRQKIRAIVGIAYKDPQELSQAEIHTLLSHAATLREVLQDIERTNAPLSRD